MNRKLQAFAAILLMTAYSEAASVAIGTASTRGEMRVDSYAVAGNSTLMDGSEIETGSAPAEIRTQLGAEFRVGPESKGRLFKDHFVLEQGSSEVASAGTFHLEAGALSVRPTANARGLVRMISANAVQVTSSVGVLAVLSSGGQPVARLDSGQSITVSPNPTGANWTPESFSGQGVLSKVSDGNYYLDVQNVKYQTTGSDAANLDKLVGKTVSMAGTTVPGQAPAAGAVMVVHITSIHVAGGLLGAAAGAGMTAGHLGAIVGGFAIVGGAAVGWSIYSQNHSSSSSSTGGSTPPVSVP